MRHRTLVSLRDFTIAPRSFRAPAASLVSGALILAACAGGTTSESALQGAQAVGSTPQSPPWNGSWEDTHLRDLGGSTPAATSWGPNRLDVFVRSGGALLQSTWSPAGWNGPFALGVKDPLVSDPSGMAYGGSFIDLVWLDAQHAVEHFYWNGSAWNEESLGSWVEGKPAIVVSTDQMRGDVFARSGSQLWHRGWFAIKNAWSAWEPLPVSIENDPIAVSDAPGKIEIFWRTAAGAVSWVTWDGTKDGTNHRSTLAQAQWILQPSLGTYVIGDPTVISPSPNELHIYAVGGDDGIWTRETTTAPAGWTGWSEIPGCSRTNTLAGTSGGGITRQDLFAVSNANGEVLHNTYAPGSATSTSGLAAICCGRSQDASNVAVYSPTPTELEVDYTNEDDAEVTIAVAAGASHATRSVVGSGTQKAIFSGLQPSTQYTVVVTNGSADSACAPYLTTATTSAGYDWAKQGLRQLLPAGLMSWDILSGNTGGEWHQANALETIVDYYEATIAAGNPDTTYLPIVAKYDGYDAINTSWGARKNDDKLWWALASIRAYDVLGNRSYLTQAESIFDNVRAYWGTQGCGGGVTWTDTGLNAITNELFFQTATKLALRDPTHADYLGWATAEYAWFNAHWLLRESGSSTIRADRLPLRDGLDGSCNAVNEQWTYNQGPILGALLDLSVLTRQHGSAADADDILSTAHQIAAAAMTFYSQGKNWGAVKGILTELNESNPENNGCSDAKGNGDCPQFKGVFMRYLGRLNAAPGATAYGYTGFATAFLKANAAEIWANRSPLFPEIWTQQAGNPGSGSDLLATQTSAIDALVAALNAPAPTGSPTVNVAPVVTSVSPATGPNSGGTRVGIAGRGFSTVPGATQITFFGAPATVVDCPSTTQCFAQSPNAGPQSIPQTVDVQVSVGAYASPTGAQDQFTYAAGPDCTSTLNCAGIAFGKANVVMTCPSTVGFYGAFGTSNQTLLSTGTSFTNLAGYPQAIACDPSSGSCTQVVLADPGNACGSPPPPPPPPQKCNGISRPIRACRATWTCCGTDGWECGVCL